MVLILVFFYHDSITVHISIQYIIIIDNLLDYLKKKCS